MSGLSGAQGPPFVQRAGNRDIFDPTALWDKLLFHHQVFNFIHIKLSISPLLWILQQPGNLNFTCSLFCSLVRMDIMTWPMWTLATAPWRFPNHAPLSGAQTEDGMSDTNVPWKGLSPNGSPLQYSFLCVCVSIKLYFSHLFIF